jgi:hypothetical protein
MATDNDSQILNYLVRMVMPMRREFGRQLDVQQFLHDFGYAREVLTEAMTSQDPRLIEYAGYISKRVHGARIADTPAPRVAAATPPPVAIPAVAAQAPKPASAPGLTEEEMRVQVLKKYTGGLR